LRVLGVEHADGRSDMILLITYDPGLVERQIPPLDHI
jgi:hypothetical protein